MWLPAASAASLTAAMRHVQLQSFQLFVVTVPSTLRHAFLPLPLYPLPELHFPPSWPG